MKPFDFIDAASWTKADLIRTAEDQAWAERQYVPWLTNKHFSHFPDGVLYANDMNLAAHLPHRLQFDFYIHSLRPKKRFSKWHKPEDDAVLGALCRRYGVNRTRALEIQRTLSKGDLEAVTTRIIRSDELSGGKLRGGKAR